MRPSPAASGRCAPLPGRRLALPSRTGAAKVPFAPVAAETRASLPTRPDTAHRGARGAADPLGETHVHAPSQSYLRLERWPVGCCVCCLLSRHCAPHVQAQPTRGWGDYSRWSGAKRNSSHRGNGTTGHWYNSTLHLVPVPLSSHPAGFQRHRPTVHSQNVSPRPCMPATCRSTRPGESGEAHAVPSLSQAFVPRSIYDVDNGLVLGFGADLANDHP
eukprot:366389-Chlamydomonas_euryale.AAC.8